MKKLILSTILFCFLAVSCAFAQSVTIVPGASPTPGIKLSNVIANRRIVLWEGANNDHQFYGLGINGGILRYQVSATSDNHVFYAGANTTTSNELMRITGTGTVGIGTNAPATTLDVRGSSAAITVGTANGTGGALYFGNSVHGLQRGFPTLNADNNVGLYTTAGNLYLAANGKLTDQFVLTTGGNVGIGTGTPGFKLDVNGNARLSHTQDASGGNIGIGAVGTANAKLYIKSNQQYGVFIDAPSSPGGYALGVQGSAAISGNLSKGGGSFKIDHPLDPENKYLYHSFVESPDMMNVYNGNITTDANGLATVTLPDYFESLNKDFRYQLTVIGVFAQAIVFEKVKGNQFKIKTDKPNIEVSWQTTGVRQDAYANRNRIPTTVDKVGPEKGMYLYPEAFGVSEDKSIKNLLKPANE